MNSPYTHRLKPSLIIRAIWLHALVLSLGSLLGFAQEEDRNSELVAAQLKSQFRETVQPVLKRYCYRCHDTKKMKSGVRVDILDGSLEDKQLFLLKHVHKQLVDKAMPPEDERQPGIEERKMVTEWVTQALQEGERKVRAKNGLVRRLTVAQYHNTLRDLLGVEDRLADLLPADGFSKEGFKNNGDTLLLTPQMMETYFEIAERALDLCLVDESRNPRIQCFRVELGAGVNKNPPPEKVVLNGPIVLPQTQYRVREVLPDKPFPFEPHAMQKRFRFIEGYEENATVREWRDFEGLHHSVFAAIEGKHTGGYNYGRSAHFVPEGLLLRPRSPETEKGSRPARGPSPSISIPMRELPKSGILQVTVEAARYDDGYLPDTRAPASDGRIVVDTAGGKEATVELPAAGIYQIDNVWTGQPGDDVVTADIGKRTFSKRLKPFPPPPDPDGNLVGPFLMARFSAGPITIKVGCGDGRNLKEAWITPVADDSEVAREFASFEKRVPHLSVHMGLRTDVGPRLSRFDVPKPVPSEKIERYSFRAPVSGFASQDTEEDNPNYLAGLQEFGIRSEPTDDRQIPRALIRAIEFEGPYHEIWPPRGHADIFFPSPHRDDPPTYAREVLERFATRAFRRPVTDGELESLLTVWRESKEQTGNFQRSIRNALLVVLTSPQFLYLTEDSASPQAEPLSPHELAAKLSYFLWNTTPDEKLQSLAESGKLRAAVPTEVDRLVADDRFAQFTGEFVHQWLSLDKFDVVNVSWERMKKETRRELRKEPIHFVTHLIRENLPLRNLLDSDFIVVNDVVAGYYGIGDRTEHGYAFAPVRHESETLGGVLTQVAILSGLTDGHESNPVKRGAWVARKIIAEPPEPPPPNVPDLPRENREKKTLRERLVQHRNQNGCMQCHEKIDPWGLPFEQFDGAGLLKKKKVDASSTLPDKTEIVNANALKKYLANDRIDQVAFSFLKHLASYATGRTLTFNETEYLKREGRKALGPSGYRMKDCVRFVIESPLFMKK